MKKKVALLIASVIALASLSGCGGSGTTTTADTTAGSTAAGSTAAETTKTAAGDESGKLKLTMSWWGNQVRNEKTQAALDLYTEQNPGTVIEGQFSEWSDYWNKLATSAAGQAIPDIVQMDYSFIDQYVKNGLLVDLTPYIKDGTLDVSNISDNTMASGTVNGGVYAVCAGINAPSLLYNKTLLDKNGIVVKDYMTTDEFIDLCREVYKKTGYKTNIAYYNAGAFLDYFMRGNDVVL